MIIKKFMVHATGIALLSATFAVQSAVVESFFDVSLSAQNQVLSSSGNGFENTTFYEYEDPAGGPSWWNAWFFNGADIKGWKDIYWDIQVDSPGNTVAAA